MSAFARPPELTERLREIGPAWHLDIRAASERTKDLYRPYLAAAPHEGVEVTSDVPYGAHPRQMLDVFRPRGAHGAPVVAFVHGGAFMRGDKGASPGIYANVLTWFARQGCVGVNIEYRLAGEAPYPGGALDVAAACEWIHRNIAAYGGNPERFCLIGHSAGGTHTAAYLCDPALNSVARTPSCQVLISARLRADSLPENPNVAGVRAYFGDDSSRYAERSPVTHAALSALPVLVANAQYENPLLDVYGLEYAYALGLVRRRAPMHVTLSDHNHMSIVAHFNTEEQWLGERILEFFEREG